VQGGHFGACLMAEPALVAACVAAMRAAVAIPVTVKCRIGIDDQDGEGDFQHFVETVAAAGCRVFIVHARKAWLKGLSPKENREIPPLDYARVYRLKASRPDLTIVINGGIEDLAAGRGHLDHVDGVMLGRAAYQTPYLLASVDRELFGCKAEVPSRAAVLERLVPYVERQLAEGVRLHAMTRHLLGLFHGQPRGRQYRRHLSENATPAAAGIDMLRAAIELVRVEGRAREHAA
jgi:tRNA-dihydrouridine synthase A